MFNGHYIKHYKNSYQNTEVLPKGMMENSFNPLVQNLVQKSSQILDNYNITKESKIKKETDIAELEEYLIDKFQVSL